MDLALSRGEQAFKQRLVEWLDSIEPPEGLHDYGNAPTADEVGPARAWQRLLHSAGWAGLSWPIEHGGRGSTLIEQAIFAEELAKRGLPRQLSIVPLELAGPMIIEFGTDHQRARYLPRILTGEEIWCQLFSEPNAGSDLARLATTAVADGDGWLVRGQKVWTSGAQYSDFGLLLARTEPSTGRPHQGITCFLVPMSRAGLEVRPILQMDHESKFNEVFLEDVRVERNEVLGEPGDGWRVAVSTLGRERRMLGSNAVLQLEVLDELVDTMGDGNDDAVFRQRWVALWSRARLLRLTWLRLLASSVSTTDPRTSLLKLTNSELQRDISRLAVDTLGPCADASPEGSVWRARLLAAPGASIAGGTSEVQRNILADRVLGLPRETS